MVRRHRAAVQGRELNEKISELTVERDFWKARSASSRPERQAMIDRGAEVPVKLQAELLGLSRSSVYYVPRALPERDLLLMLVALEA